jgi:hypothetical protein
MKRYLMILAGLLAFVAGPALADQIVYYPPKVTGKKARRQIRHYLYGHKLTGDKKVVFDKYGWTPHRLRINAYGRVTERWQYLEEGLEFVFDMDGTLVDKREIPIENRREGIIR